jgi:transcription antitermination factor NusG
MRSELRVVSQLTNKGVEAFIPCYQETRKWSDRTKLLIKPLIPGYVFVRVILSGQIKLRTLETFGVHSFVAFAGVSPPIPDEQMSYLKQLSENNIHASAFPGTLRVGAACADSQWLSRWLRRHFSYNP